MGRRTFAGRAISFVCVADCARPFGLGFAERRGHSCLERFAMFLPNPFACELTSTSIRSESASLGFWERRASSFCSCACFLNKEPLDGFFMLSVPGSATSISLADGFDFLVELMRESLAILSLAECFGKEGDLGSPVQLFRKGFRLIEILPSVRILHILLEEGRCEDHTQAKSNRPEEEP